jgi:hypothetical protein
MVNGVRLKISRITGWVSKLFFKESKNFFMGGVQSKIYEIKKKY